MASWRKQLIVPNHSQKIQNGKAIRLKLIHGSMADIRTMVRIERLVYDERSLWQPADLMQDMRLDYRSFYIQAMVANQMVGFVGCHREIKALHVINLAIHPDYQGQGIGTALLDYAKTLAPQIGRKRLTLEVRVSNSTAEHLYRKMGFKRVRRLSRYYSDHEDAWLMATKE